jgi:hypothetical protein
VKAARQARPLGATANVYPALEGVFPDTVFRALLDAVDAVADRFADRIVARIAPASADRFAGAKDNPLGSARAFLDAGRRGDFPTFKRGREVVARWADVLAYIEGRQCRRKARPAAPANTNTAPTEPLTPEARRRAQLRAVGALPGDRQ